MEPHGRPGITGMAGWGGLAVLGVPGRLGAAGSDAAFGVPGSAGVPGSDGVFGAVGGAGSDGVLGGVGAVGALLTPAQAAVPLRPRARAGTMVRSFFDRATLQSCMGVASSWHATEAAGPAVRLMLPAWQSSTTAPPLGWSYFSTRG
jgi:hypothetical protein